MVSLPLYTAMSDADVDRVIAAVRGFADLSKRLFDVLARRSWLLVSLLLLLVGSWVEARFSGARALPPRRSVAMAGRFHPQVPHHARGARP